MKTNHWLLLGVLTTSLIVASCSAEGNGPRPGGPAAQGTPGPTATPAPTRAITPRASIVADGALALGIPPVAVGFETTARVTKVNVEPGQKVKQGDVLAELDDSDLKDALAQAQEALAVTEAQVGQNLAPAREADIKAAQAGLSSAGARYREVKQGASASEIEQALRSWNQAKNNLYSSQVDRDRVCEVFQRLPITQQNDSVRCPSAQAQVKAAEENERAAFARYQALQQPVTGDKLTQAYADIASAQANLNKLEAGPTDELRQVGDAQLSQARLAVQRAERRLSQTRLLSPCDCTVQTVNIAAGAMSTPNVTAFELVNLSGIVFQTSNLSERDLAVVRVGASVSIRLKPFERPFTGSVRDILPQSAQPQRAQTGAATTDTAVFTVLIDIDPAGAELLPGMTGQAEISVAR